MKSITTNTLTVVRSAGEALGAIVGLLVNVLDPEAVVVGGGLGLSEGPYWESLCAGTRSHTWSEVHRNIRILRALTAADAGWLGAATAARESFVNISVRGQRLYS